MGAPRTGEYVISPKELSPSWVTLYIATFVLQIPCAAIRGFIAYPVIWVAFKMVGAATSPVHTLALVIGYGPLALSLATLILPLGGWWWEQQTGGRTPSERERLIYDDAIEQLKQHDPSLREPRRWFMLDDEYQENAAAYADTLMITRGLMDSGYMEPILAHELGHLNSSDGRLSAALHRITTPPRGKVPLGLKTLCFFATGAAGMWPLRAAWGMYWRSREHHADHYAANLGQANALGSFLDEKRALHDLPVPFMWLSEHTHPPSEHRVERLSHHPTRALTATQPGRNASPSAPRVADRTEPVKGTPTGPPKGGS